MGRCSQTPARAAQHNFVPLVVLVQVSTEPGASGHPCSLLQPRLQALTGPKGFWVCIKINQPQLFGVAMRNKTVWFGTQQTIFFRSIHQNTKEHPHLPIHYIVSRILRDDLMLCIFLQIICDGQNLLSLPEPSVVYLLCL